MDEQINWNCVKKNYENGESLTKLSEKLGISRWTLTKKLKDLNTTIINRQNKARFDDTIFDFIDTEEKAYWLGFIFADGYISNNKSNKKSNFLFELTCAEKDLNHLIKFNKFTKFNGNNIKPKIVWLDKKRFLAYRWCLRNKHMWNVLNSYGCVPNKSLILTFPDKRIFANEDLIRHFVRGYFDGDGCISYHKNAHSISVNVSMLGTKNFLETIIKYSGISAALLHDKRSSEETFSLSFNKENGTKFINWLYSNCNIYLTRKYYLYLFFKNGSRSIQEWVELLSIKNGELCDENTVVTKETKKSFVLYSVEVEPTNVE